MTAIRTFKDILTAEQFESMRQLVHRTFPNKTDVPAPTDGLVDVILDALPAEARVAIGIAKAGALVVSNVLENESVRLGLERGIAQVDLTLPGAADVSYFIAYATHTRHGHGAHEFTAELPMVRIKLPEETTTDFKTLFGTLYAGDHKVPTAKLVREKYHEFFAFDIGDVFLTTPARLHGARFAAIATYEVFDTSGALRAWVLEAGMATGEGSVLYSSPHAQPIERKSWYRPTPFSSDQNWYRGVASFGDAGPEALHVQVSTADERKQKQVHMEVRVHYVPVPAADVGRNPQLTEFPAKLTARAAMRVAAIAVARGDMNPLYLALAPFGHALDWNRRP